jgi:hypothetical protein
VREFTSDNGSCDSKYAGRLPNMKKYGPARLPSDTTLHFPAMSDDDSVSSEPSKHDFKRFWLDA